MTKIVEIYFCSCKIFPNLITKNYKSHVFVNGVATFWLISTCVTHFPTFINIAPTLVPYLLSLTGIITLITSYPNNPIAILITYPTNLTTLLITYPTNLNFPTNLTTALTTYPTDLTTLHTQPPY
jgi:hypothetical protein